MNDPLVEVIGLHHVRLPVSDVLRSRDWYIDVLGFEARLCVENEDSVVGVVLDHPTGLTLGLHCQPDCALALRGFCCLALNVGGREDLNRCCGQLDNLGIDHSSPAEGHLGWYAEIRDPDGLVIQLHTAGQPSADEA